MYCPRCATQNIDSARYCRSCGANLSLVPQALSGQLSEPQTRRSARLERRREPDLTRGIRKISIGLAFLAIIIALLFGKKSIGMGEIWILIPAFLLLGKGIGEIVNARSAQRDTDQRYAPHTTAIPPTSFAVDAPPSVTENTTRRLEPDETKNKTS